MGRPPESPQETKECATTDRHSNWTRHRNHRDRLVVECPVRGSKLHDEDFGGASERPTSSDDAAEVYSVIDLHPEQPTTVIRGSSSTTDLTSEESESKADSDGISKVATNNSTPGDKVTKSGRVSKPPEHINITAFGIDTYLDERETSEMTPIVNIQAMAASANPDILYYHEAMKAPDRDKFILAMEEEVKTHTEGKHWKVVPRDTVPSGKRVLPSVWAMRRKRRLESQEVYKWKARLNVHGGKQKYGIDYWETYSPVVQWTTTRLFLILSVLRGWNCRQLDFVAAYPQAPSDTETYMEFPKGISSLGDPATHVLLLLQNIYWEDKAVESGIF